MPTMKTTMAASEFKTRCLKILEDVRSRRQSVLITKKGRPLARLVPADEPPGDVFGCLAGIVEITGDVVAPAFPLSDWERRGLILLDAHVLNWLAVEPARSVRSDTRCFAGDRSPP